MGHSSLVSDQLRQLVKGLTKVETKAPLQRTGTIPSKTLLHLFQTWPENFALLLQDLRLKAITLLALSVMLRPSDIAPRSGIVFRRSAVTVQEDQSVELYFLGIKNDADRDGFRVFLRRASDTKICPVDALLTYMSRTV